MGALYDSLRIRTQNGVEHMMRVEVMGTRGPLCLTYSTRLDSIECGVHVLRFQGFFSLRVNSNIT